MKAQTYNNLQFFISKQGLEGTQGWSGLDVVLVYVVLTSLAERYF